MLTDFEFTRHALARLCDMAVDTREIEQSLTHPERIYKPKAYPGTEVLTAGRLSLSVSVEPEANGKRAVITALWATAEDWEADYALPPAPGREPRSVEHLRRPAHRRGTAA